MCFSTSLSTQEYVLKESALLLSFSMTFTVLTRPRIYQAKWKQTLTCISMDKGI